MDGIFLGIHDQKRTKMPDPPILKIRILRLKWVLSKKAYSAKFSQNTFRNLISFGL
jgi:hypothetical protein